jgi:hypothetical protein
MAMAKPIRQDSGDPEADEFREAMPMTAESFGVEAAPEEEGKFIAVVTLVLVALVVIALAVLFARGLDTIRGEVPQQQSAPQSGPQSDSSGSLEL